MASSRESSPVMDAASPTQLTPNSKVKALLASLDKDSDDESISKSPRRRILTSITKSAVPPHPIEISGLSTNADEKSDSEEEEIFRPKGRMAGRMQANKAVSEDSEGSIDENPQARVKKVLKAKSKSPTTTTNKNDSQESEDSDLPVRPRKRKVRTPRHTPNSSPEKGTLSPGLFVSPRNQKLATTSGNGSDSDELPYANNLASNSRFLALVEQKKEERKAREAQAAKERAEKAAERSRQRILSQEQDDLDKSDDDVERRLTQRAPTRKASKRALEDMHRETQRLSRNQQLAHNATTKKKYTRSGLLAKFNYQTEKNIPSEPEHAPSSSPLEPNSDVDMRGTPPTSPASHRSPGQQSKAEGGEVSYNTDEEPLGLKDFNELRSSPPSNLDKGKGKAIEEVQEVVEVPKKPRFTQRSIRVRPPKIGDKQLSTLDESDSDLEIVAVKIPTLKKKIELIFDRVPENQGRESHSIHTLRMLAHLSSPGKQNTGRNKKPSITTSELQVSLQQRARQQAAKEREERLEALRAKGVIIQTAEEREREMAEVDDLLARARQEGEAIMKRERAAAKKQKKDEGEPNHLQDDSDDEDWEENKAVTDEAVPDSGSEDDGDSSQNDTSGESDEENGEEEAMDVDDPEAENSPSNLDQEADETNKYESELRSQIDAEMTRNYDAEEDGEEEISVQNLRRPRKSKVISDDEDTDGEIDSSKSPAFSQTASPSVQVESPNAPNSVLRSASKTFIPGLPVVGVAGLGLTQIFAGTMDTSQSQDPEASPVGPAPTFQSNRDGASMAFLRRLPVPELPPFVATLEDTQDSEIVPQSQLTHIPESQTVETQAIRLNFTQSQFHGFDSLVEGTQMSPFPDATQDVGFQHMTPIKGRFVDGPPSTIDTVVLGASVLPATAEETPVVKKKGKLRRRAPVIHFSDEEDNTEVNASKMDLDEDELDVSSNAFDVMRKSSNKKVLTDKFNKKKSDAKQMVQEQAEESEDEYAGLGGASDDESGDEEDALVKEMIDDEAGKDANERELAAFYANRERAIDEKQVEKLYNDITKGMLRRKRGADYDLSDSDDGGEARQRRKRKEFAKMRKALLADERIGKIAENPKKQAFLRALEDRGSEDEMDFLEEFAEQGDETDSQSQTPTQTGPDVIPNSQPTETGSLKTKQSEDAMKINSRLPPHLRRTKSGKKPSNLSDIRDSLSSLIEEPNAVTANVDSESESEAELEIQGEDLSSGSTRNKENRDPFALRRAGVAIIDRISLKRQSSSSISNSTRLAFSATSTAPGFKVPPLLRRATTNSSITSSTDSISATTSTTERMAGGSGIEGVKRGGGKNSGVNYFARENERRAAVVKTEKRREQKLVKGAQVRRKVVGGMLGGGKFE